LAPAADDALTREIEALREQLVGLGRALASERESQAKTGRELAALRQTLAALAELDRAELHLGFGSTAKPTPD
jgi:chromosome segregation ATPase